MGNLQCKSRDSQPVDTSLPQSAHFVFYAPLERDREGELAEETEDRRVEGRGAARGMTQNKLRRV